MKLAIVESRTFENYGAFQSKMSAFLNEHPDIKPKQIVSGGSQRYRLDGPKMGYRTKLAMYGISA